MIDPEKILRKGGIKVNNKRVKQNYNLAINTWYKEERMYDEMANQEEKIFKAYGKKLYTKMMKTKKIDQSDAEFLKSLNYIIPKNIDVYDDISSQEEEKALRGM